MSQAPPKIPKELLFKIKEANNLIEIVGEHVVLRKSGANYTGLCPFHSERSPSFSVSEIKQLYHCYGCKQGGDLFSFVMNILGVSFLDAVEELADRANIKIPSQYFVDKTGKEDPQAEARKSATREKLTLAFKLNRFVAAFYHQKLSQSLEISTYLNSRGVSVDLIRSYYLGAAPAGWDSLTTHLIDKKAPLELAVELGLIRPSPKTRQSSGKGYFDLFRNRAIFPILDMRGKVAGFGGRVLAVGSTASVSEPKYLNSTESLTFQKSRLAFGLYQAQKHMREKDEVIVVEGYFDVLALFASGFTNVVSTCGTALTLDHLSLFRKFASKIILLFDGDKAGVSATERAMNIGLEQGVILYGACLPENLDPDEVLIGPSGQEKMQSILAEAKPLLDTRIEDAVKRALQQGPEVRSQAIKDIAGWLAKFHDPVGKEVRLQSIQSQLNISRSLIEQAMGNLHLPRPREKARLKISLGQGHGISKKISYAEKVLLTAIVQGAEFTRIIIEARSSLPPKMSISDLFDYAPARAFVANLVQRPGALEQLRIESATILEIEMDTQVRSILTEALMASEGLFKVSDIKMALGRRLERAWAHFSQQIKRALVEAEAKKDAGLQAQLMKEYLDVQRRMKEFNSFYDEA